MSLLDTEFWKTPLFPSLHEYITLGSTEGFWERPLFPPPTESHSQTDNVKSYKNRKPSLESLSKRELMASDLTIVDETLVVSGTAAPDNISFVVGDDVHQITINGEITEVNATEVQNVRFFGSSDDSISLSGSENTDDRFGTWNNRAELQSDGLRIQALGFGTVASESTGGNDRAYVFGSGGDDELTGSPDSLAINRPQSGASVDGYSRVYIFGGAGEDSSRLEDSPGNDRFISKGDRDVMEGPDSYVRMDGFENVEISATNGGADRAYQRGTDGDDLLILTENIMKLSSDYRSVTIDGFERTYAYAGEGEDEVRVYDSVNTEIFTVDSQFESAGERNKLHGERETVRFYSGDFYRRAEGFYLTEAVRVSPERMAGRFSSTGAVSVNVDYEAGERDDFYIEQQRRGAELIESGLATGHTKLTTVGIQMIQWGLDQQAEDGGFPNSDDAVHSTTMFMRALGHAIYRLDETPFEAFTPQMREEWIDGLTRMADWVIENQDLRPDQNLEPFSHRYFLRALGFRQANVLTGLDRFDVQATNYFDEAITRLNRSALLVEDGGFDLNYQSFGLRLAADYYDITTGTSEKSVVERDKMIALFKASYYAINERIDANGIADMSDSSRADEVGREGRRKTYDYRNAIHAFLASYKITKRQEFFDLAQRTFNGKRS
ncbi:MAG: hypothetical protein AAF483_22650 [Planctomycetota bacterium]